MKRVLGISSIVAVVAFASYILISGILTSERLESYRSVEEPQVKEYQQRTEELLKSDKQHATFETEALNLKSEMNSFKASARLQNTVDIIDDLISKLDKQP